AVYNAYNRHNPYTYVFTHDTKQESFLVPGVDFRNREPFSLYQISFFPILPTVSYSVLFDDVKGFRKQKTKMRKTRDKEGRRRRSWLYFEE
ncbi:MAG: hypothetical protein WC951_08570, partial [Bacteroidales bacterium]